MIDPPRHELNVGDRHEDGEEEAGDHANIVRQSPDQGEKRRVIGDMHQERKDEPRQDFRLLTSGEKREEQHQPGQGRVDDPRPVRQHAIGRIETMGDEIVPALAGEEVAHLHQAHRIVGVVEAARLPDLGQDLVDEDERDQRRQQRQERRGGDQAGRGVRSRRRRIGDRGGLRRGQSGK